MQINTPKGAIKAHAVESDEYPGIWISIGGDENKLVLVEYDTSIQDFAIRVWDHRHSEEDYVYKQVLNPETISTHEETTGESEKHTLSLEVFDDLSQDEYSTWTQICRHCAQELEIPSDKLSNGGENMVCGVKSCINEADYYLDIIEHQTEHSV